MSCLCPLRGPGSLYVIDRGTGTAAAFRFGNSNEWAINADVEEETLPDYEDAAFADCAADESISNVQFAGTAFEFCPKNQRLVMAGTSSDTAAGAVADAAHSVVKKQFLELVPLPDPSQSLTVETVGGATTYVEGTDYLRGHSGIYIMDSGSIPSAVGGADNIQVSYTGLNTAETEAFVDFGNKEYTLILDVKNTAQGGVPMRLRVHRAKFGLLTNFPFMGQTFQSFPVSARLFPASEITGAGLSKYFKVTSVNPAETV